MRFDVHTLLFRLSHTSFQPQHLYSIGFFVGKQPPLCTRPVTDFVNFLAVCVVSPDCCVDAVRESAVKFVFSLEYFVLLRSMYVLLV